MTVRPSGIVLYRSTNDQPLDSIALLHPYNDLMKACCVIFAVQTTYGFLQGSVFVKRRKHGNTFMLIGNDNGIPWFDHASYTCTQAPVRLIEANPHSNAHFRPILLSCETCAPQQVPMLRQHGRAPVPLPCGSRLPAGDAGWGAPISIKTGIGGTWPHRQSVPPAA
jgi:hypothetical protein